MRELRLSAAGPLRNETGDLLAPDWTHSRLLTVMLTGHCSLRWPLGKHFVQKMLAGPGNLVPYVGGWATHL
jgi:hypothetical protein